MGEAAALAWAELMRKFTLLFRAGGSFTHRDRLSDQRWAAWIKDLDARGLIANLGQPLDKTGLLIEGRGKHLRSMSFAELNAMIDGFVVLAAHNIDEAVEISRSCPIFEEGGSVEVRPVLQH
jgi:hypothetical protein